ncbi:MAG: response regulator [Blastocatellia bacterium]|nr:response regulator [Blastocatellia bacterium]
MMHKILFVDDEPNVLDAYQRTLRREFTIDAALSGAEGLKALESQGPYAVIISDMRMPVMDGVEFLLRAKRLSPTSVRVMLTGNADQQTAIDAVNEGNIFRFLTKPCPPEVLARTITASLDQYRLVMAEKELLEKTLNGSIHMLTDILSLVNPAAFGRATRVRRLAGRIAAALRIENVWKVEIAAMLSQVGCIAVPEEILLRVQRGHPLNADEFRMVQSHSQIGYDLIRQIPRLEWAAEAIAYQDKHFNGEGWPVDDRHGHQIPVEARILKLALDFDRLTESRLGRADALKKIQGRDNWYDPDVVRALELSLASETRFETRLVRIRELTPDMILAEDIVSIKGLLLIPRGQEVTRSLCMRMANFHRGGAISEPIKVLVQVNNESC